MCSMKDSALAAEVLSSNSREHLALALPKEHFCAPVLGKQLLGTQFLDRRMTARAALHLLGQGPSSR